MPPAGEIAVIVIVILVIIFCVGYVGYQQVGNFVKVLANFRRAKSEKRKRTEVEIAV